MQTVILAAGEGTRMRPLTDEHPKPMLPVADRPLVAHVADAAVAAGATRFVFVVGYRGDVVRDYFGDKYREVPVEYVEQQRQRGTADAVRTARDTLSAAPFAVLNGDILADEASTTELFGAGPAVGAVRVEDPSNYGVLDLTAEGRVVGVTEKPENPSSSLANAGAYVFPAEARQYLDVEESDRGELELTDVLERTCAAHDVAAVAFDRWLDVGRPWELLAANERKLADLDRRIDGAVDADATVEGAVVVEEGATIEAGVTVEGPVLVRSGATVGPNAYLRGATVIGHDARIGHAVEVKNSVLRQGVSVCHLSYVGDSILGCETNFGAGTTVANLRHDGDPVAMTVKGRHTSTGRRKFGVVVGDRAKTGINTGLNPGVVLGTGAHTRPGETLFEDRLE